MTIKEIQKEKILNFQNYIFEKIKTESKKDKNCFLARYKNYLIFINNFNTAGLEDYNFNYNLEINHNFRRELEYLFNFFLSENGYKTNFKIKEMKLLKNNKFFITQKPKILTGEDKNLFSLYKKEWNKKTKFFFIGDYKEIE